MTELNKLIYGKNDLQNVVAVEINDAVAEIFIEKNGEISSEIVDNRFWLLASRKIDDSWVRLDGDLNYCWGKQYKERERFNRDRSTLKHYNDVFSIYDPKEAFLVKDGFRYFKGMKHGEVTILSFDIESNGLSHNSESLVYIISNTFRKNGVITRKMFSADEYPSQNLLIDAWTAWVREMDPSIICGHNIFGYDLPYLEHIAKLNNTQLLLGRDESPIYFDNYSSKFRKDGSQDLTYTRSHIYGRNIVDTMFLAIKHDVAAKKYESFGLKSIIATEGLEVVGRQFYDAALIKKNWNIPEERTKIKAYALHDADDALALYDLMSPAQFYVTQSVPKSFQSVCYIATGSQLNALLIASYLQDRHSLPKSSGVVAFQGAISRGLPGIHSNVLSFDVASLYPSTILSYEIYDPTKDPKKHFYKMVEYFTKERLKNKKLAKDTGDRYYNDLQEAMKIFINSSYGLLGTPGLLFNYPVGAAKVTEMGRFVLTSAIKFLTGLDFDAWERENNFTTEDVETEETTLDAQL